MALSLCSRTKRRRIVCVVLPDLSGGDGTAGADDGTGGRTCEPQECGAGVLGTGKAGQQMAPAWLGGDLWLLYADDVLYDCIRMDGHVFL